MEDSLAMAVVTQAYERATLHPDQGIEWWKHAVLVLPVFILGLCIYSGLKLLFMVSKYTVRSLRRAKL